MIGKLLGHTQVQTTARYAHLASATVKIAVDEVSNQIAASLRKAVPRPTYGKQRHLLPPNQRTSDLQMVDLANQATVRVTTAAGGSALPRKSSAAAHAGRIYQTIDDVRAAVRAFVALYNAYWLIAKNSY